MKKKKLDVSKLKEGDGTLKGGFASLTQKQMERINGSGNTKCSNTYCGGSAGGNTSCLNTGACNPLSNQSCTNTGDCNPTGPGGSVLQ